MKKTALALCAALASTAAGADTFGLDVSTGIWQPAYTGDLGADDYDAKDFSLKKKKANFIQVALEHPIPLIPNMMLSHSRIRTRGSNLLDSDVTFGDETFYAGQDVKVDMKLDHTDATLYYEILDNQAELDLGVTARRYRGFFHAVGKSHMSNPGTPNPAVTKPLKLHGTVPMLYGKARLSLPLGLSLIAQGNATEYEGDRHMDLTAKLRWDIVPAVDLGVEAGYRMMRLNVAEMDDLQADMEVKGPYLGLSMHL